MALRGENPLKNSSADAENKSDGKEMLSTT